MKPASREGDAITSTPLQSGLKLVEAKLAKAPLEVLSAAAGIDETQASRVRSGQLGAKLNEVVAMLYSVGLKVVPADRVCVDRATYEAMTHIATKAMAQPEFAKQLVWDE